MEGEINFYRDYQSYSEGFGLLFHEFWLGNEDIYHISRRENYELRIDLEDFDGDIRQANYTAFTIGPAMDGYRLSVSGYSGDTGNSFDVIAIKGLLPYCPWPVK